jgi:hypothetical protein
MLEGELTIRQNEMASTATKTDNVGTASSSTDNTDSSTISRLLFSEQSNSFDFANTQRRLQRQRRGLIS